MKLNKHMITITESIEYFIEVNYDIPANLKWEDLDDHPELEKQISSKMNGDYASGTEITIDEVTKTDFLDQYLEYATKK